MSSTQDSAKLAKVADARARLAARRAAQSEGDEASSDDASLIAEVLEHNWLTTDQVLALPPPSPLVGNLLFRNTLAMLYGPSGVGKTFVSLDIALSVAHGVPWFDHATGGGRVVYVVGEGAHGMGKRVRAWRQVRGVTGERWPIHWLSMGLNLASDDAVDWFAGKLRRARPSLVVIDTLARCMVGLDENSNSHMSRVADRLDRLRRAARSCVLLDHHTGKDPSAGARGGSALKAAIDTEIELTGDTDRLVLANTKQRNAAESANLYLRLLPVTAADSCVVAPWSGDDLSDGLTTRAASLLDTLHAIEVPGGVSTSAWLDSADLPRSTFFRVRKELLDAGHVENVGSDKRPLYRETRRLVAVDGGSCWGTRY
jgi:hypothetical protein